ncbi:MAG: hypothetical protein U9N59_05035 [Campylobacterota bacterium]|nr:hypothetical protein [Campylobacterota bacterium]
MSIRKGAFVNLEKGREWGLSLKEMMVMIEFSDLSSWATTIVDDNKEVYYLLYASKIQSDIPSIGSKATISRILTSLEDKGLVESLNKLRGSRKPAFRLTKIGKTWTRDTNNEKKETPAKIVSTSFSFELDKPCGISKLDKRYREELLKHALLKARDLDIEPEVYKKFGMHYKANGKKFADWSAAFNIWLDREVKFKKSNGGDDD